MDASVIQSAIELFLQNADWIGISGLLGLILPVLIELFTKKITGKWKIVIVFATCLVSAVIQNGVEGGFKSWNWSQFSVSFTVIITLAVNMWNQMWKKWFPDETNPIEIKEK